MNAIVVSEFGSEDVLKLRQIETPRPGPGQVRVQIRAAGVNPVETYIRTGHYSALPALPYTPGNDGAGIVDSVGEGVTRLKKGDRVFIAAILAAHNTGTYAEYAVCDENAAYLLPDGISFEQGAGIGTPGLAAVDALFFRADIKPAETVLVHGASGGVGTLAVQLARRAGARVFGTAGDEAGLALVKKLGAHGAFNHREDGYTEDIVKAADGQGPDVIIEMAAHANLMADMGMLARYGRAVVVGSRGSLEFDPRATMTKDAAVLGMNAANLGAAHYRQAMHLLAAALETGLEVVVSHTLPLEEAARAHREVAHQHKNGKIILTVG